MFVRNEDTVYVLRHLGRRHLLGESPLAKELVRTYGVTCHRDAVIIAITNAFASAGTTPRLTRLRDLIVQCDLQKYLPRREAALAFKMAPRTFARHHAFAVQIITDYLNDILGMRSERVLREFAAADPREEDAGHDGDLSQRFAGLRRRFATARLAGDPIAMNDAVHEFDGRRSGLSEEQNIEMRLMRAEVNLELGHVPLVVKDLDVALHALRAMRSRRLCLMLLLLEAQLAFSSRSCQEAHALASAVYEHADGFPQMRDASAVALGRLAALTGTTSWRTTTRTDTNLWHALWFQCIDARMHLLEGRRSKARELAAGALRTSSAFRYTTLAAWAAATLAACETAQARDARVLGALRFFAAGSRSICVARDLFQYAKNSEVLRQFTCFEQIAPEEIAELFAALYPESRLASTELRHIAGPLIFALYESAAAAATPSAALSIEPLAQTLGDCVANTGWNQADEERNLFNFGEVLRVVKPLEVQAEFIQRYQSSASAAMRRLARRRSYLQMRSCALYAS